MTHANNKLEIYLDQELSQAYLDLVLATTRQSSVAVKTVRHTNLLYIQEYF